MMSDEELEDNVESLGKWIDQANAEIRRLRAENLELRLKNDNLLYYIRSLTGRLN